MCSTWYTEKQSRLCRVMYLWFNKQCKNIFTLHFKSMYIISTWLTYVRTPSSTSTEGITRTCCRYTCNCLEGSATYSQGVSNDLKFRRSALKLFLKDGLKFKIIILKEEMTIENVTKVYGLLLLQRFWVYVY